jgi:hypothetical protein
MAKKCNYDVSVQMRISKQNAYSHHNITQQKLDAMHENVNKSKFDTKVNDFGLLDLTPNFNDPIYLEESLRLNTSSINDVNSNLLHFLISEAEDEYTISG